MTGWQCSAKLWWWEATQICPIDYIKVRRDPIIHMVWYQTADAKYAKVVFHVYEYHHHQSNNQKDYNVFSLTVKNKDHFDMNTFWRWNEVFPTFHTSLWCWGFRILGMTELIAFQAQCKWSWAILPSSEDDWRDLSFRESVNVFACSSVCAGVCVCVHVQMNRVFLIFHCSSSQCSLLAPD